jgi:hypothetical protein
MSTAVVAQDRTPSFGLVRAPICNNGPRTQIMIAEAGVDLLSTDRGSWE